MLSNTPWLPPSTFTPNHTQPFCSLKLYQPSQISVQIQIPSREAVLQPPFCSPFYLAQTHKNLHLSEEAEFVARHPHLVRADMRVQETSKQGNKTSCGMLRGSQRYFTLLLSVAVAGYQFRSRSIGGRRETIKIICRSLQVASSTRIGNGLSVLRNIPSYFSHLPTALERNISSCGKPPVPVCSTSTCSHLSPPKAARVC